MRVILFFAAALLLAGCSGHDAPVVPGEEMLDISLRLVLADESSSRAYDSPLDYDTPLQRYIADGDIYIIFFDADGRMALVPDMDELDGPQGAQVRVYSGRIPKQERLLSYRVIANVAQCGSSLGSTPAEVLASLRELMEEGTTDAQLCALLTFDGRDADGKWHLTPEGGYLPMQSSMSRPRYYVDKVSSSVPLYRSVAKIGVEYTGDPAQFTLTKVRVYRQSDYGAVISPYIPESDVYQQFTMPYIPPGASFRDTYAEYDVTDNAILEQIFVPEFDNTGAEAYDMHIMAGGYLSGCDHISWYDMRFTADGRLGSPHYDVVRNHSYIFRISRVTDNSIEISLHNAWDTLHEIELE